MRRRFLPALLLTVAIAGCPEPPPPIQGGSGKSGGQTEPPTPPTPPPPTPPTPPPVDPPGNGGPPPPWRLIPEATLKEIAWPMLDPVATWPAPESLVPPEKSPVARAIDPEEIKALAFAVSVVLKKAWAPSDPRAAVGLDDLGRVHMKLGRGKAEGSASMSTHPPTRPPTFAFALETGKAQAKTIDELRAQVSDVVSDALAEEMSKPKFRLQPHPKGTAGVGLAALDTAGIGSRFRYLYAYSSPGKLLVVMHEVPWVKLKDQ